MALFGLKARSLALCGLGSEMLLTAAMATNSLTELEEEYVTGINHIIMAGCYVLLSVHDQNPSHSIHQHG